ncbi:hypothetical protein ACQEU6_38945 [Spirillospora sp. CA-108201]
MKKLQPLSKSRQQAFGVRLQEIWTDARRLVATMKRTLISVAAGTIVGVLFGVVIGTLGYAVQLADNWHDGAGFFTYGDWGGFGRNLLTGATAGAIAGFGGAVAGRIAGNLDKPERVKAIRVAHIWVITMIAFSIVCVPMAAFGVTVVSISGTAVGTLARVVASVLFCACPVAAGFIVGAVRAED